MATKARTKLLVHPGEVLHQEFLEPMGMSASALARALDVPGNRITEIVAGRRSVTADTAIRLSHYFGTSVEFWTNMQTTYDLVKAEAENDYSKVRARVA
jgi:antitoxin HigA-1